MNVEFCMENIELTDPPFTVCLCSPYVPEGESAVLIPKQT
ncbi:unnamed protein product [Callosobruchus maculatus]|uniref:Uncharacterized protein n=1 Tax=Callosobruchus maculatus TaxID=64391 RepID=A0A653CIP9_CALMS|nr:unnamed protein product [Callosobruchus maculatus]